MFLTTTEVVKYSDFVSNLVTFDTSMLPALSTPDHAIERSSPTEVSAMYVGVISVKPLGFCEATRAFM